MMLECPKCKGNGSISEGSVFVKAGETPPLSKTCDQCNGTGEISPRFFVEFTFDNPITDRRYWLPLYIMTNDKAEANRIVRATKKALEEQFTNVIHSTPLPEIAFNQPLIKQIHFQHNLQKLTFLNVRVWEFKDIEPNPEWNFDEHLAFAGDNGPLTERTIATCLESYCFPVRIIKEGQSTFDFNECLLINIVEQ